MKGLCVGAGWWVRGGDRYSLLPPLPTREGGEGGKGGYVYMYGYNHLLPRTLAIRDVRA